MLDNIFNKKDNNGAIVLIAVMIMATLLTAALGTGTLVINIINQSASIDYSIAAYYAAESGIEKNLYSIRKDGFIPDVKRYGEDAIITDTVTLDDNVALKAHYDLAAINGKDSIIFNLEANNEYSVDVYNPSGSVDVVQLQVNGNSSAEAAVTIQITAVSWTINGTYVPKSEVETLQQASGIIHPPITLNLQESRIHKIKFKAFGGDLNNLILTAYNNQSCSGDCSTSLPGTYVLTSTGSYPHGNSRQATQVLTVEMPILEPAYGLYNFVIFSEGDITKSVNWD
ncbi:hypothetical protein ISR92_03550 [Patescibacteria group bacterium]|nr:hypothetical protein [Patescibacteria group bacterium]